MRLMAIMTFPKFTRLLLIVGVLLFNVSTVDAEDQKLVFSSFQGLAQTVATEIIKEAYRSIGISIEIKMKPVKRSLAEASTGRTDGVFARILKIGKEYPTLVPVDETVLQLQLHAFVMDSKLKINSWEDLNTYRVGIVRGLVFLEEATKDMDRILVNNSEQLFKLLVNNRVDVVITTDLNGLYIVGKNHPHRGVITLEKPIEVIDTYHFLHEKNRDLIPRISASLTDMKSRGRIKEITDETIKAMIRDEVTK